jgi:hypothetical protein
METTPALRGLVLALASIALLSAGSGAQGPVFFPDDPLAVDVETQDASGVAEWKVSDPYDFFENSFKSPGDRTRRRAMNVNTIDEVPDSSWFTNRIASRPLTAEDVRRGPDTTDGPAGVWTVISGKTDGVQPGFTIRDAAGIVWFVKFDPLSNPEMATGAEMIATKLFWAMGYHVPENHLATLRRDNIVVAPDADQLNEFGRKIPLTAEHVDRLLLRVPKTGEGTYRVLASRALEGKPVGPFKYYGTRPDDPNDVFPHEHRRELRGLKVFSAWLNHDDSGSSNSLDTLVSSGGRTIVRHHLIDFGSTLGSGSVMAQTPRAGNEYLWDARPTIITALTLGFWVRPWIKVEYPDLRSLGNIEAAFFQPERWKPEYPNMAFDNARADDVFWAARRVMAVSDEMVRAAVDTAQYSDRAASLYLGDVIIARRDKIGLTWLTELNPLIDFALDAQGTLTFRNFAAETRRGPVPAYYLLSWARFDNHTGLATPIGDEQTVTDMKAPAPAAALRGDYVQVQVAAIATGFPEWAKPVQLHFRRTPTGWTLVGLRRLPGEI